MTIKDSNSYINDYSYAANRVMDIYMSELKELNMKIRNAIYDELESAAAEGFSDGWLAASVWMIDQFMNNKTFGEGFSKANAKAKQEEMKRRFYFD